MGLPLGSKGPSEKRLREFEAFMRQQHRDVGVARFLVLHEHFVRLCLAAGVVGEKQTWSMDSTSMECYGAVKDTIRLLGDGVSSLARYWSKLGRGSLSELAGRWDLPHLGAKSTKGAFRVNWREPAARAAVVDRLARGTLTAVNEIRSSLSDVRSNKHKRLLRRCRNLLRVIDQDLDTDEQGRLVVAERVARARIISLTDPQARHGRKSRKKKFNGFKTHIFGDALSGLITALTVTAGNAHDGSVAARLIRRAKALSAEIGEVLGDTAYGGAALRHDVKKQLGVSILAPPPPISIKKGRLDRTSIVLDFEKQQATCAAGVMVGNPSHVFSKAYGRITLVYNWPATTCQACSLNSSCNGQRKRGHQVRLHPYEPELRQARTDWQDENIRRRYRDRSQTERLVNQVTRHGGRKAGAPGLGGANLQAHTIAMRNNLVLLARALVARQQRSGQPSLMAA